MITPEQIAASCAKIIATPEWADLVTKAKAKEKGALGCLSKLVMQDIHPRGSKEKLPSPTDIGEELVKQLSV